MDATDVTTLDRSYKSFLVVGGASACIVLALTLADIVISMIPGWSTSTAPILIQEWFTQLQNNPLLGLRNLDLLNTIISLIGLPMYLALYQLHKEHQAFALLAFVVVAAGTTVFISNNPALPLFELSKGYSLSLLDNQKLTLETAGQALLTQGVHGSLGAFAGFFLSSTGTFLMCLVMQKSRVFVPTVAWLGLVGSTIMVIYTIGIAFLPDYKDAFMVIVMAGGLLMMVWNVMVALRLFQLSGPNHPYPHHPGLANKH